MAFPTLQTTSLDTIISTSLQAYLPELVPQVITSVPGARFLLDEKAVHKQGGTRINAQLLYGFNSTTTFYNMADYIDVSPQEAVTAAQYKWALLTSAITLFGEEESQNSGEPKIQDLADAKLRQLEYSVARAINQAVYGDGTGSFGAAPDGLSNLIFPTATPADPSGGAVGGISAVTFPFWRNNANTSPGTFAANGSMGTGTPDYQLRMWNLCTDGNMHPNVILSDYGTQESYNINAGGKYRTVDTANVDLGFSTVDYKNVPWVADRDCTSPGATGGTQFYVNTEFLHGVIDPSRWFQPTPWMPIIGQDGKVMRVHMRYNIVCTNRLLQGVIQNWT